MDKMKYGLYIIIFGLCFSQDIPSFDAKRAMDLLKPQCAFGARHPGSPGHIEMKKFMQKILYPLSDSLYIMDEAIPHPYEKSTMHLTNYLSRYNLDATYRIMLMAHWDSREFADRDPDPQNHKIYVGFPSIL